MLYTVTHPPWMAFVERQIERWNNHFDWLFKCPRNHDIMLVRYEDLKSQLVDEMERILKFLHVPYDCKLNSHNYSLSSVMHSYTYHFVNCLILISLQKNSVISNHKFTPTITLLDDKSWHTCIIIISC